jgi:LysM repeat protein
MKYSAFFLLPLAFFQLSLLNSCDKSATNDTGKSSTISTVSQDDDQLFGPWSSKAELQFQMERLTPDQYFSKVQGRCFEGVNQYRAVIDSVPRSEYREWAAFWGLTEKELFDYEISLLRLGFVRNQTQVFMDSSGVTLHQLIMLCPVNAVSYDDPPVVTLDKSKIDPVIVEQSQTGGQTAPSAEAGQGASVEQSTASKPDESTTTSSEPKTSGVDDADIATEVAEDPDDAQIPKPAVEHLIPKATVVPTEKKPTGKTYNHIVVKGDTLSSIARRYRISVAALKSENNLGDDALSIKQLLTIPAAN